MDRLKDEIEAARGHVNARWDDSRAARVYSGVAQLRRRRHVARALVTSGGAALAISVGVVLFSHPPVSDSGSAVATEGQASTGSNEAEQKIGTVRADHKLRLADGSTTRLAGARSELDILENAPSSVALRLRAGLATFEVVPNEERRFVVSAGEIDVIVVGTAFEVERLDGVVRVAVRRGKVRVVGPDGVRYLEAGQARLYSGGRGEVVVQEPPARGTEETVPAPELPATARKRVRARGGRRGARVVAGQDRVSWRGLVEKGDHEGAYAALAAGAGVDDEPGALLDAADAARLSGFPHHALRYLQQVVVQHRSSPVAPLAAFTMGRVLLDRLGQPHRAAEAFAEARALSPVGSLAQDALARQVEALSKGGYAARANELAREYLRLYPGGRRQRAVTLYGGL
ncbi:MAG: FecR domain-containing protein [Myxococcales bacterium]|nr:FecR domain-containing protein [Myxococcales bacterium]